jgi:ATP-dependent Lon protease
LLKEDTIENDQHFDASISSLKDLAAQIIALSPNIPSEAGIILKNIENPSFLIHFIGSNLNSELKEKQELLETNDLKLRTEKLMFLLQRELQFAELKNKVTNKTKSELDKQQRDYFLQQQLKSIKEELGGESNDRELMELRRKADAKDWPIAAKEFFKKNIEKLDRMHPSTPDYSTVYNHVDLMLDLPWNEITKDNYNRTCDVLSVTGDRWCFRNVPMDKILPSRALVAKLDRRTKYRYVTLSVAMFSLIFVASHTYALPPCLA